MVGQQATGVRLRTGLLARLGQGLEEIVAVRVLQQDRFPAVPPAQGVMDGPSVFDSKLPWHEAILCHSSRQVKRNSGPVRAKLWLDPNLRQTMANFHEDRENYGRSKIVPI